MAQSHRDRLVWLSALALAALIVAAAAFRPGSALLPGCPFHAITGLYCPGCGSTRMLYYLLHGHPALAFSQNPLTLLLLPVLFYGLMRQLFSNTGVFSRIHPRWIWSLLVILAVFTIARNLPWIPFSYLAPGGLARFF